MDPRLRRGGLFLGGVVLGLLLLVLGVWVYLRSAREAAIRNAVRTELGLPDEVFEIEEIRPDSALRIRVRDVALLDPSGDTILAAPVIRILFDPTSLAGEGPIEFGGLEIVDPLIRAVQAPDGTWNLAQAVRLEAGGEEVDLPEEEDGAGRAIVFRDVSISDARLMVATPLQPGDSATAPLFASGVFRRERVEGEASRVAVVRDIDAVLPVVRVGGEEGWRVEVARFNAALPGPELGVLRLAGSAEALEDGVRFDLDALRLGGSELDAEGVVRFAEAGPRFDVQVRAHPLDFGTLRALFPQLPEGGQARFALDIESREGERIALTVRDMQLAVGESRASGRLTAIVGGGEAPVFRDTRIVLEPLRIETLEQLGLADSVPVSGEIRGTVASAEPITGVSEGSLRLDLTAQLRASDAEGGEPSVVGADGLVAFGEDGLRFRDLRLEARPLRLELLASLFPERADLLRGTIRGAATVQGTPSRFRVEGGQLAYAVGEAPPTRFSALDAEVALEPELRYELRARAEPLALATLSELFPALPFRTATLTGPLRVSGSDAGVDFNFDLQGDVGGLALDGSVDFGEVPRFEVSGRLDAFRASELVTATLPTEGPLSGTVAASGTPEDFRFNVDLAQATGQFALEGRVLRPEGAPPRVDVAGTVREFRLGSLVGDPGLFDSPVSGPIDVSGGGRLPYRFDVDLRGPASLLDLAGSFDPGEVPAYELAGRVAGLNLRGLPGLDALPPSQLNATVSLRGRGTTPETLAGSLSLVATGSRIGDLLLETAVAEVAVRNGVLIVDTLVLALPGATRLAASGTWGLTRGVANPLRFSFTAADLEVLGALLPPPGRFEPDVDGALALNGWIAGSLEYPTVSLALRGRGLHYEGWRAQTLALDLQAAREVAGWRGEAGIAGEELALAGAQELESLRLESIVTPQQASFALLARRDRETDLALSALLELEGEELRGIELESLALNLDGVRWQLANEARIRWGGVDGVLVDGLLLRRSGQAEGTIAIDGRLPPTGTAELRVHAAGVNLGDLRLLIGQDAPDVGGILALDATLEGPVGSPELVLDARIDSLRYSGVATDRVVVGARYDAGRLAANADLWVLGEQIASAEASLPADLDIGGIAPSFRIRENDPMSASILADSLPLQLLAAAVPGVRDGDGISAARIRVDGTPSDPVAVGWAAVDGGALTIDALGARYQDIGARIVLSEELIRVDSLFARNEGTARLEGTIRLAEPNRAVYLTAELDEFRAIDRPDLASLEVTGQLALSGQLPVPVLTGGIVIDDGTVTLPESTGGSEVEIEDVDIGSLGVDTVSAEGSGAGVPLLSGLRVDAFGVEIDEGVWLTTDEARVQLGGELLVYRTGGTTRVYGDLEALRGVYTLAIGPIQREFEVVSGRVQFFGTPDINPALDVVAANEVRSADQVSFGQGTTILVQISGTLEEPRIQLTSDARPPLTETELLSLLIVGRPGDTGGGRPLGFAEQAIAQEIIGGIVLGAVEEKLLEEQICDYVRVRTSASDFSALSPQNLGSSLEATALECGREIFDQVFLTGRLGAGAFGTDADTRFNNVGASVIWQLDDEWSASAAWEPLLIDRLLEDAIDRDLPSHQFSADVRRRWEYGTSRPPESVTAPPDSARPTNTVQPPDADPEESEGEGTPLEPPGRADATESDAAPRSRGSGKPARPGP